jgi:hypothetical protein
VSGPTTSVSGDPPGRPSPQTPSANAPATAAGSGFEPDQVDLDALDRAYQQALRDGRPDELPVVGYGEISIAFGWPPQAPTVVAKSLPTFRDERRFAAYVALLDEYLDTLAARGVDTLPTAVRSVTDHGERRAYVLQPRVPGDAVGPAVLARADRRAGTDLLTTIVANVMRASDRQVGIDGQVSNWAVVDGSLHYLDVSTPMLRRPDGRDRLDTALLAESVPWILRGPVDRFVAPEVLSPYHEPRRVVLDTAGNLLRERLGEWLPVLLDVANPHLDEPLSIGEVHRFYRGNARLWSTLQLLRRIDRGWQIHVRRRTYPFLLPESFQR